MNSGVWDSNSLNSSMITNGSGIGSSDTPAARACSYCWMSGGAQQLPAPVELAGESFLQALHERQIRGQVADVSTEVRESGETAERSAALVFDQQEVHLLGRVFQREPEDDRPQQLRLARTRRADEQSVRPHPHFGGLFEIQWHRLAGAVDPDGNPEPVSSVLRLPPVVEFRIGGIGDPVQRREIIVAVQTRAGYGYGPRAPVREGDPGDQIRRAIGHLGQHGRLVGQVPDIGERDPEGPTGRQRPSRTVRQAHRTIAIHVGFLRAMQPQFDM